MGNIKFIDSVGLGRVFGYFWGYINQQRERLTKGEISLSDYKADLKNVLKDLSTEIPEYPLARFCRAGEIPDIDDKYIGMMFFYYTFLWEPSR